MRSKTVLNKIILVLTLVFFFTSAFIGYSSFISYDYVIDNASILNDENEKSTIFIKEKEGVTYSKLETAIDDANEMINSGSESATIVINPGSTVYLNESRTLMSGVDLLLPYSLDNGDIKKEGNYYPCKYIYGTTYEGTSQKPEDDYANHAEYNSTTTNFSDSSSSLIKQNLSSTLIINNRQNLTLSDGSNLTVFSQLGRPSSGISGLSSAKFSQIIMMPSSTILINSGGILDNRGYIKEGFSKDPSDASNLEVTNNSVIINNGEIVTPFVIYDYGGGSATVSIYASKDECPFSSYDLPQIHANIFNQTNGLIQGRVDLYTGYTDFKGLVTVQPQHNTCFIKFLGNNSESLYYVNSGSTNLKYYPKTYYYDQNLNLFYGLTQSIFTTGRLSDSYGGITKIEFNSANVTTHFLTITVSVFGHDIPISTEGILFPISYNFEIIFNDSNFEVNTVLKFMPGSRTIFNNSNIISNSGIVLYGGEFKDAVTTTSPNFPYPSNPSALFELNNSEWVINNANYGGFVSTNGSSRLEIANIGSQTVTDSAGGTLSIGNLEALDYGVLTVFLLDGKFTPSVKNALKNASTGVTESSNTFDFAAYVNEEGNTQSLESLSVYEAESDQKYFKLMSHAEAVNISISVYKNSGFNLRQFGISIYLYSDSNLTQLIEGPLNYHEDVRHETNKSNYTTRGDYYLLVKKSNDSKFNISEWSIKDEYGNSLSSTQDINSEGISFKLNNLGWSIYVSN